MTTSEVADGIWQIEHAAVNCYLVEDGTRLLLVDAGLPATWPLIVEGVGRIGRRMEDIEAIALTHAHFDHVGTAARARTELGIAVWVHQADAYLAAHPYRYKPQTNRFLYALLHPTGLPYLAAMTRAGALNVRGVDDTRTYDTGVGSALDLPGSPKLVFTPGHTFGHCALHFADRDAVIAGDALVTLDPYTGTTGPQIIAPAATADTGQALASLDALAATGARVVLPGHGKPWTGGAEAAVTVAQARGAA